MKSYLIQKVEYMAFRKKVLLSGVEKKPEEEKIIKSIKITENTTIIKSDDKDVLPKLPP